jgi:hypothetical protein
MKTGYVARMTGALLLLVAAGCKTTEPETKPLSWKEQSAYLGKVKDPRMYGFSIYRTPGGSIEYRDGIRLHPRQGADLAMKASEPLRPVVDLKGGSSVLLDFSASSGCLEFGLAKRLGALPVGERTATMIRQPGEEIDGSLSVIPVLRFQNLYVERPLMVVRMATGPLGRAARGVTEPQVKGVVGWDLLRKFDQIQLDYAEAKVRILTQTSDYQADPSVLVAMLSLVKAAGGCAVRGTVDGRSELIVIDPAGDFELATPGGTSVAALVLAEGFELSNPAVVESPGAIRLGAQFLKNYKVTVCPKAGVLYFEKPVAGE